jgi:hypothetical protein
MGLVVFDTLNQGACAIAHTHNRQPDLLHCFSPSLGIYFLAARG